MKKIFLLAFAIGFSSPSFAGGSQNVLTCRSSDGQGVAFRVFYEVKSGRFGGFLGLSAARNNESLYCFGACGQINRRSVSNGIELQVLVKSGVTPALDQNLILTVPETLLTPNAQGTAQLKADLIRYEDGKPKELVPVTTELNCTAEVAVAKILDAK